MLRFVCLALMAGCAAPQIRPTKTAQSVATGERYKNSGGFLSEGGPDIDIGPSAGEALLFAAVVGGAVWAVVALTDDDAAPEPQDCPAESAAQPDSPAWARPLK